MSEIPGVEFYLEFDTINEKRAGFDNGNVLAVFVNARTRSGGYKVTVFSPWNPCFVREKTVSKEYLLQWCLEVSVEAARVRQPGLVDYIEDMKISGGIPFSKRNTPTDPFIPEMSRV